MCNQDHASAKLKAAMEITQCNESGKTCSKGLAREGQGWLQQRSTVAAMLTVHANAAYAYEAAARVSLGCGCATARGRAAHGRATAACRRSDHSSTAA